MAWKKWMGTLTFGTLASSIAVAGNGCSSSATTGPTDGGAASDVVVVKHPDSGIAMSNGDGSSSSGDDGGGDSGSSLYDGTTGQPCKTDMDCRTNPNGPGSNVCTNDVVYTGSLGDAAVFPTPICVIDGPCDPTANGTVTGMPDQYNIAYCDGDPTDPASPGICLPSTNPPTAGKGICVPQCSFTTNGAAATGCEGNDICWSYGFSTDATGAPLGIGYCYGGCTSDADCTAAGSNASQAADQVQHCDTLYGICTTTVTTPSLAIGAGCNSSLMTETCDCVSNQQNNLGFCSSFCKQGGTSECPTGWICDLQEPLTLTDEMDASMPGWTTINLGLAGFCTPACNIDAGGATMTDSGACPPNSSCQTADVGGPDCLPLQ